MNIHRSANMPGLPPVRREGQAVSSSVMGMLLFVIVEIMMFAGLISAFTIVRTSALGEWPPPGQPRLPVEETLLNTAALLLSGVLLFFADRYYKRGVDMTALLGASIGMGAFFVVFQGYEWLGLIREGLTLTSSNHGSFFYMIVGMHAIHAVGALALLAVVWMRHKGNRLKSDTFYASQVFWYFVVGLWPLLYWRVYL